MFTERFHQTIGTFTLVCALAAPALAGGAPYTISGDFSQGCVGKCLCMIADIGDLEGSFSLVDYQLHTKVFDPVLSFQLIDVDLSVVSGTIQLQHFTGIGSYTIVNGIIVTHQLTMDLVDDNGAKLHLDSGMIPGGQQFPDINIVITPDLAPKCFGSWYSVSAVPTPLPDPADLNGDGSVNALDLGILLNQWSSVSGILCGPAFCPADFNHDGAVDSIDLGVLLSHWTLT